MLLGEWIQFHCYFCVFLCRKFHLRVEQTAPKMARFILSFAFVVVIFAVAKGNYLCYRNGQACANSGTCDQTSGACTCPAANNDPLSYDCSLVNAQKGTGSCTTACTTNGGDCFNGVCACPADRYGTDCELKRLDVICTATDMTVNFNLKGFPATGKIHVKDQTAPACDVNNVPSPDVTTDTIPATWQGKAFFSTHADTSCGASEVDNTVTPPANTRYFYVRFMSSTTLAPGDLEVKVTCGGTGDVVIKQASLAAQPIAAGDLTQVPVGTTPATVTLEVKLKSDGSAVDQSSPQKIGTLLTLDFTLTGASTEYTTIRLNELTAWTTADNSGSKFDLVLAGCTRAAASSVIPVRPTRNDGTNKKLVKLEFKLFKFDSTVNLFLKATVKACKAANEADCAAPSSCSTEFGRKKRAAERKEEDTANLRKGLTLAAPNDNSKQTQQAIDDAKECTMSAEITATLAALAVAVVLLLILCIILVARYIISRREEVTYKEYDNTVPTTQLPKLVSTKCA